MLSMRNLMLIVVGLLAVLLLLDGVYTVQQTERAIVLRFGSVVSTDVSPGLHFKLPIAETVKKTDARVLTLHTEPEQYFTLEKKPVTVDSFAKWRVKDVTKYYEASSFDEDRAVRILQERVNEGLRNQISRREMREVVSGSRDTLMAELTGNLDKVMQRDFGVEVIDVRVKRIDLPPEASTAVYERMNSERQILARQFRATGRERALAIRADADRKTVVIAAEAYRTAEQTRGDGDARSAEIYAEAYGQDPEFYEFYRTVNAYSNVFQDKSDLLVLDPKSQFMKYLKRSDG
jgi:membrane protease subunit HflC